MWRPGSEASNTVTSGRATLTAWREGLWFDLSFVVWRGGFRLIGVSSREHEKEGNDSFF